MRRRIECQFETDVLDAVYTRRWPDRVDADLRAHVAGCQICSDVVAVAHAFEAEHEAQPSRVDLPESGLIWWKAQLRAREDARRTAGRPITVAQAIAFASLLGVIGAIFGASSKWLQGWITSLKQLVGAIEWPRPSMTDTLAATIAEHYVLALTLGAFLLAASLAVVLVLRRD